jgi:hypothetical protein
MRHGAIAPGRRVLLPGCAGNSSQNIRTAPNKVTVPDFTNAPVQRGGITVRWRYTGSGLASLSARAPTEVWRAAGPGDPSSTLAQPVKRETRAMALKPWRA